MIEDHPAVPAPGADRPLVSFQYARCDTDLGGQVRQNHRGKVGLVIGEAAVLTPKGELGRQSQLAAIGHATHQRQILRRKRPARHEFVFRPHPLHSAPSPATVRRTSLPGIGPSRHHKAKSHSFAVTGPACACWNALPSIFRTTAPLPRAEIPTA